jgi:hypothetical protein
MFFHNYSYCNIKTEKAKKPQIERKIAVISRLWEGSSIRGIERITGINQNTIMSLGRGVDDAWAKIMDTKMRGLTSGQIGGWAAQEYGGDGYYMKEIQNAYGDYSVSVTTSIPNPVLFRTEIK